MKIKIILRQLPTELQRQKLSELGNLTQTEGQLSNSLNSNRDEIYDFIYTSSINEKANISELILFLCSQKKIPPDTMQLYISANQGGIPQFKKLNDSNHLSIIFNDTNSSINSQQKNDYITLYYSLCLHKIKVSVDFYQMKIDKIYIKLSLNCTVLMLKNIINAKLNRTLPVSSQKIYGLGLIKISEKTKKHGAKNTEFNNDLKLMDIVNCYENNTDDNYSNYVLHLLLVRQLKNKLQMGLNFKFNYFKNVSKINFNSDAPTHCECSDGLNLFSYCRNAECKLYNQLFVYVLGYGCYEVIRETFKIKCPYCQSSKDIEVKNIGLINSKWYYKGILNGQKQNIFEGDGITIDDQLYILQEAKLNNMIYRLYIEIKPHFIKNEMSVKGVKHSFYDEYLDDLEDISLCEPTYKNVNTNANEEVSSENLNLYQGVKIINNDDEIKSMDVLIDGTEKIKCAECLLGNFGFSKNSQSSDCSIF